VEEVAKSTHGIEDDFTSWKEQVQNMSKVEFEAFLRAKANEILNKAAEGVLDELVDKVLGEEDNGQQDKEGQEDGELSGGGTKVEMGDRVLEAASVTEASKMQVRASPRLQRSRDEHILAKAEERVARKNLEFNEGNPCHTSLLSVNRDLALNCLQQIGFNLGKSSLEKDNNLDSLLGFEPVGEVGELGG
jgi:hypothetical protein